MCWLEHRPSLEIKQRREWLIVLGWVTLEEHQADDINHQRLDYWQLFSKLPSVGTTLNTVIRFRWERTGMAVPVPSAAPEECVQSYRWSGSHQWLLYDTKVNHYSYRLWKQISSPFHPPCIHTNTRCEEKEDTEEDTEEEKKNSYLNDNIGSNWYWSY